MKNAYALMGLTCGDCVYFQREGDNGVGVCLISSFEKGHCNNEVCNAFTHRGCEDELGRRAIANLQKKYIEKGINGWHNPYAK